MTTPEEEEEEGEVVAATAGVTAATEGGEEVAAAAGGVAGEETMTTEGRLMAASFNTVAAEAAVAAVAAAPAAAAEEGTRVTPEAGRRRLTPFPISVVSRVVAGGALLKKKGEVQSVNKLLTYQTSIFFRGCPKGKHRFCYGKMSPSLRTWW